MYKIVNNVYIYIYMYIHLFSTQCPLHMDDFYERGATDSVINQQGRHVVHKKPSVRKGSNDEMDEYIMLIVQHE